MPAIVREPSTADVLAWLDGLAAGTVAISPWVAAEFSSALALKVRRRELSPTTQASALAEWQLFAAAAHALEIGNVHFEKAGLFCQRHELGLRAGDALHLAVAAGHGCTLVTLDQRMAKAAPALGVPVAEI